MGILKTAHQISLNSNHFEHSSYATNVDGTGKEERSVSGEDCGGDFGDCKLAEVGCECIMFQGQLFNIPYELYDLPDLKDILSLETWNCCLTDEERFILSAYLPDMDQYTFWSTMKELLGGNDMFFGSPLAELFGNLKGGFYHENVKHYTEGLQFLQGLACCHTLRSYHENMIGTFSDMKRLWDPCCPNISVKERLRIWKAWKNRNEGVNSLDLNAYPEDEVLLSNEVSSKVNVPPLSKKVNSVDSKGIYTTTLPPPVSSEMKLVPLQTTAKGVLKIKPTGSNALQTHVPKLAPIEDWDLCLPPAKWVLKTVPKGHGSQQEQPRAMPIQSEVSPLVEIPVSKTSRFPSLPNHRWDVRDHEKSLFPHHKVGGIKYYRRSPDCIMDQLRVKCLNGTTGLGRSFHSSMRYAKESKDTSFHFITSLRGHNLSDGNPETIAEGDGSSKNPLEVRYTSESENCSKNLVQGSRELSLGCLEAYHYNAKYQKGEQKITSTLDKQVVANLDISDGVCRKSEFVVGEIVYGSGAQKLYHQSAGLRDELLLPKTYKRRKLQTIKSLDVVKPPYTANQFQF